MSNVKCIKKESIFKKVKIYEYHYIANDVALNHNPIWYQEILPHSIKYCHYYKSGWGNEFRYVREEVGKSFTLESVLGRSSAQYHPYVVLEDSLGNLFSYNLFYSGNWRFGLENNYDSYKLTIGFENEFYTSLTPQKEFVTPRVGTVSIHEGWSKLRETWQNFTDHWMKKNNLQQEIPVAWNHWWAYEDTNINEQVFLDNVNKAAEIGVDVCVLDAGWFGNSQHWFDVRGDWNDVDISKFPKGIAYLSKKVHEKGMKFGFWVEIEGLGKLSKLAETHPDFVAMKDNEYLGYICFGNREVVQWAVKTVSEIIENYHCDWVKFDFNLDPGFGCDCTSHGHGLADGLYEHYQGLYTFFSTLNQKYPEVVFENCSSGGQRTDLGILANMHFNFLSDPDYPHHKERCIKNAGEVLPANRMYHFMPSQTCGTDDSRPFPNSDLAVVDNSMRKYYTRLGMLTSFGISHRLRDYDMEVIDFLRQEITLFKERVKYFLKDSFYFTLTKGLVNFHIYQKEREYLLMAFSENMKEIKVKRSELKLDYNVRYTFEDIDTQHDMILETDEFTICFKNEQVKTYIIKRHS